ncbi:MAG: SGNH/GDSL hydrolase family protein [Alphaproteobacteria bacterium]|nr:SGNH/GDSL hydrolase family protein [Alphaproteobacteria bacterium]
MKKVLFFGDSITDAWRNHTNDNVTGIGYATLVKANLSYLYPNQYEFYNRGNSGNRVVDLYARIKKDCINLKPDYMSILIGVNDVWHEICENNGVDTKKYEMVYDLMIEEILKELPDTKIMIFEPFVLEGTATCNTTEIPNKYEIFKSEVALKAQAAKSVAVKHNLPFIELQNKFDELSKKYGSECYVSDGVHPTAAGHEIIKREWIEAFEKIINNNKS